MLPEAEDVQQRVDACGEALRRAGIRVTHQRLEILREVAGSRDHPDAETVFRGVRERLPSVSLDTVYRTLWLLTDMGLITTLGVPQERFRFDGNMRPHHHFVCTRCGLARDFYSGELDELRVPAAVQDFGVAHRTQVEVRGICRECLEAEEASLSRPQEQKA